MRLKEFLQNFVEPNTLIRLVYKTKEGHVTVGENWDEVSMEWKIIKGEGIYKDYVDNFVIGITDILCNGHYSEAVNIVISEDRLSDIKLLYEGLTQSTEDMPPEFNRMVNDNFNDLIE